MSAGGTFRAAAVITALLGALLAAGSWDGLYDSFDLPQALPALGPQIGGLALLALAFVIWSAAPNLAMRGPVGTAAAFFYLATALVIASWLIFRDKADLEIGDGGWTVLIVAAVVFALLGAALARAARS